MAAATYQRGDKLPTAAIHARTVSKFIWRTINGYTYPVTKPEGYLGPLVVVLF
jgi:hypothetical protein